MERISGNIVDIFQRRIFSGCLVIENGKIVSIEENSNYYQNFISPGLIDAHVHIESSMLLPEAFSRLVIPKGSIAVVTDPHEIANVMGVEGIDFMIENSRKSFLKFYFTVPSCVPATSFDFSGACIDGEETERLLDSGRFIGLSEVMNVPGVLAHQSEIIQKIKATLKRNLVVDGHAPGLTGTMLREYIRQGITTDHECTTLQEALEKIELGMCIQIREGSAAKNYELLKSLIRDYPEKVMFCTDDSHPGDLISSGHIDKIVRKAVQDGFDLFDVLRIANLNPIRHYQLNAGSLQVDDPADFVIFKDLESFEAGAVYIQGQKVYDEKEGFLKNAGSEIKDFPGLNSFFREKIQVSDIVKTVKDEIICIKVVDHEIVTRKEVLPVSGIPIDFESDLDRDILKIVYLNRYRNFPPQVAYIRGIGLKEGAFASSVSHDSHNIIAVGCCDADLVEAVNAVIGCRGGLSVVSGGEEMILPLPVAGIMSGKEGKEIAEQWERMNRKLKERGVGLDVPFMTLSFMALIVVPELKIGEKGLFEYSKFDFIGG